MAKNIRKELDEGAESVRDLKEKGYSPDEINKLNSDLGIPQRSIKASAPANKDIATSDLLLETLTRSVSRLEEAAVNAHSDDYDSRIDLPTERQLQVTALALWKMLDETGRLSQLEEKQFQIIIKDSIALLENDTND